ncbi:sulfotransferase [Methyloligella sp. GL2]|uniref:sulfotransferase family protein n=2 Tax=unclassified Methyloligella TaxID=2625955 RepID=UPI001FEDDD64|nr:sulfotransferase [Methyloligella sp. GL2]
MANMFAAHPQVFIPMRETEIFHFTAETRRGLRNLQEQAKLAGKPHLAEKTPIHVFSLDRIRELVPGATFVIMMRDGRDVAASFVKRWGNADGGFRNWVDASEIATEARGADDAIVVRYEDLIADPQDVLEKVCGFVGMPFDPAMLEYYKVQRSWFGVKRPEKTGGKDGVEHKTLRSWQVNQPIFDGRGGWRKILRDEDVARFKTSPANELMQRFGYAVE